MSAPRTGIHLFYLQLAPADIAFVKFLFESYEEVGIVRTIDRQTAVIVVLAVEDFLPVAREIVREVQTQLACVELQAAPIDTDDWLMREIQKP